MKPTTGDISPRDMARLGLRGLSPEELVEWRKDHPGKAWEWTFKRLVTHAREVKKSRKPGPRKRLYHRCPICERMISLSLKTPRVFMPHGGPKNSCPGGRVSIPEAYRRLRIMRGELDNSWMD